MLETFDKANWILISQQLQQLLDKSKLEVVSENELEQAVAIDASADALRIAIAIMRVGDFQTRWDVAKIFPQIGTQAIVPLIEILEDESADLEMRWFALRILAEFNEPQIIISLVKLIEETQEEELAIAAAQTLAKIGQSAITALIELLKEEKTRLLAVKSLAQIRRSEVIEALLSVVDDSITEVRFTAIEALSSFHHKCLIPVFIKALQDTSFSVRKEAIIALKMRAYLKEEFPIVNHLQPLIYDINSEVCQQAILALGCMKDQMAIQTLFDFLNFPNAPLFLNKEAVRALNWSESYQALDYLKQSLYSSEINLCEEIITVLGRQESTEMKPDAAKILIDFLNSKQEIIDESRIKQAIVTSLGELKDKSALTYLEKLADDKDSKVKLYALAAMKKIT
ncbi:MAG: HEAT repeat domain-containing protein [Richelia sp. SL_2_1]|nr:HEAT repeat domain-containing protein [Richelia sp. SL_2_1]